MSYDDPILKELGGYFKAEEPGRRERAEAWATAIGLQKVDGLTPSQFLFDTARDHIDGRITQNQARRRIRDYWRRIHRTAEEDKQKIRELTEKLTEIEQKIVAAIMEDGRVTQGLLARKIGIARTYVTKLMGGLQSKSVIRRVGSDKGGHWEIVE